jgi:two-component system chemotaxis response regulator CheY
MEGLNKRGRPYRVLIIDDLPLTAKQLGKILTTEGFDVVDTADDGYQGVMMYKALYPTVDLVTLNLTSKPK